MVLYPKGGKHTKGSVDVCRYCKGILTNKNWTPSQQKYGRRVCSPCWSSRQKKYQDKAKERDPLWEEKRVSMARERRNSLCQGDKEAEQLRRYKAQLRRVYGLSYSQYTDMMDRQDWRCFICLRDTPTGRGVSRYTGFHVDHDHKTGVIRGILCSKCNMMLGLAEESVATLLNAADYLEFHKK